jgi:hypothetical protein
MGFFALRESPESRAIADAFRSARIFCWKNPQCGTAFALFFRLNCATRTRMEVRASGLCAFLLRVQNSYGRGMIACQRTGGNADDRSRARMRFGRVAAIGMARAASGGTGQERLNAGLRGELRGGG